jgi:hypothetical protein
VLRERVKMAVGFVGSIAGASAYREVTAFPPTSACTCDRNSSISCTLARADPMISPAAAAAVR